MFLGGQNFTAQASDDDCDLRGSAWYVNGAVQARTWFPGCTTTTSQVLNFTSPGNYLVEVQAFDMHDLYSSSVAWSVTVIVRTVEGHLVESAPYAECSTDCRILHQVNNTVIGPPYIEFTAKLNPTLGECLMVLRLGQAFVQKRTLSLVPNLQ